MDLLESLEIYIPEEAEVKNIPLCSLPGSVLKRINLPQPDIEASRQLPQSPEGIWICPVVLRRKQSSHTESSVIENMSTLMTKEFRGAAGPHRMSFVSSNVTAYKLVKETMPGRRVTVQKSNHSLLPPGWAPQSYNDAVIIYRGRIYLSIRKTKQRHQPASQSSLLSTSDVSSERPKEEPLIDSRPKRKRTAYSNTTQSEKTKNVTPKGRDAPSSKTTRLVSQSTDSLQRQRQKDARGDQASREATSPQPPWPQLLSEQEGLANTDRETPVQRAEEAVSTDQNNDMDVNRVSDDQTLNSSSTSQGAACASTSLQQECDFKALEQEERIAQLKARIRLKEATLNLSSS